MEVVRAYLTLDKSFNQNSVNSFYENYLKTIQYADLDHSDLIKCEENDKKETEQNEDNKIQYRRENGVKYNKIDNVPSSSSLPDEVRSNPTVLERQKMNQAVFPLREGEATIQWPANLSKESFEDLEVWLNLIIRRAKRSVVDNNADASDVRKTESAQDVYELPPLSHA